MGDSSTTIFLCSTSMNREKGIHFYGTRGKKMLRKLVSVIILLLLATPILAFTIRPAKCATILSQNFDDELTGSAPNGWVLGNPSICSLAVNDTVYYGGSGKSARYADTASYTGGSAYVGTTFADQRGYLTLSFEIMAENPDYFSFYIDSTDGIGHGANIYFTPYGYLAYYDESGWHNLQPFSVNTWYSIKMEINIPANTYDIYVDNAIVAQGVHFRYFGQTTHLNQIEFGQNSWETPIGFIDDLSIVSQEQITPVTPIIKLTGSLNYLLAEDVNVRLDALVEDAKTMAPVSNASVTVQIYYPNGSLWVSDTMLETQPGTGIYEWESSGTINEMNLAKGVYLVVANASAGTAFSTDILLFHIDPSAGTGSASTTFDVYVTLVTALAALAITGALLLKRYRKLLSKTSKIQIDTAQTNRHS
jgi:hypothetical protein